MNFAIKLLTSAKFAVATIAVIILLSAVGTFYPGGDVVFGSWPFLVFIGLLALSTALCSLTRLVPLWRSVMHPPIEVSDQFLQKLPYHASISGVTASQVKAHWKGYNWHEARSSETTFLFAQKGRIGRFGPHIAHFGALILLLGVAVGAAYGYANPYSDKIAVVPEGSSLQVDGFALQLNDFNVSYYDNGAVRDYRATVTLIDGNQVQTRDITVNGPITYRGLTFYLYGYDSNGVIESGKASWVAFQIKSDAGLPLVWLGAVVTLAGIMVSLYVSHKRIWMKGSNENILLGAISNKSSARFFKDIDIARTELKGRAQARDVAGSKKI
jgi:cytochrome c biogenesis protein ResB